MKPLRHDSYHHIVVLTGAGISAASGLPTYRGPGGLWEKLNVADVATAESLAKSPDTVRAFFASARDLAREAMPNAAHRALVDWELSLPRGVEFTLITQNVDGLHLRAGSRNVIELHGNLFFARCQNASCDLPRIADESPSDSAPCTCERCGAMLRPDVVLFGEPIPVDQDWKAKLALRDCDLFVAIGTSGSVSPASNFVRSAAYAGARTVLLNLEAMSPRNPSFREEYLGRAEELVPRLLGG